MWKRWIFPVIILCVSVMSKSTPRYVSCIMYLTLDLWLKSESMWFWLTCCVGPNQSSHCYSADVSDVWFYGAAYFWATTVSSFGGNVIFTIWIRNHWSPLHSAGRCKNKRLCIVYYISISSSLWNFNFQQLWFHWSWSKCFTRWSVSH